MEKNELLDRLHAGTIIVEQPVAVAVGKVDALGLDDDGAFGAGRALEVLPGVDPVTVLGAEFLGVERQVGTHDSGSASVCRNKPNTRAAAPARKALAAPRLRGTFRITPMKWVNIKEG